MRFHVILLVMYGLALGIAFASAEDGISGIVAPKVPPEFSIELVAGPPLVERARHAALGETTRGG